MTLYPKILKWLVPSDLLRLSIDEMSRDGSAGNEGVCLWLGQRDEATETATISNLILLRGPGVRKAPANVQIDPALMREVHRAARERDLILIGQIHSHGREYGVDLSWVDVTYGVSVPYYLSVVAPDYAMTPATTWGDCGTHIYLPEGGYVRVNAHDVIVESSDSTSILTISNE